MKGLIFTYLLTYGGSVLALYRPFYGFLVYVCFSIIKPENLWHWSVPVGNYSRIIAIAFLASWALNGFGNRRLGLARGATAALIWYWIWAAISAIFCEFPQEGFEYLTTSGKIILPAIAGLTLINSRREVYYLSWTIVASLGYVAYELNLSYYAGFNRLEFAGFGGMDNNSMTIALVTGIGFSFFLGLSETVWWRRYAAFAAAALMTNATFFSFSRGGMLGLCFVGLATAIVIPKSIKNVGLLVLGACVALAMVGPEVWEEFRSISPTEQGQRDWSAESRLHLWGVCVEMTLESPVLGKGPQHYPLLVDRYSIQAAKERFGQGKQAHTLWLQAAAELGIPGVTLLAMYYVLTIFGLWKIAGRDRVDSQGFTEGAAARMVWTSLVGFVVSAQFVSLVGLELPYYVTIVGLGVLKLASMEADVMMVRDRPPASQEVELVAPV